VPGLETGDVVPDDAPKAGQRQQPKGKKRAKTQPTKNRR
jgi:YidC/Oxa1 family membrane protein insertase